MSRVPCFVGVHHIYGVNGSIPGGFILHMTGYAPACTKSLEKGGFF